MKYYVISGETSGDNHASRVISQLKTLDPDASFKGMGGDQSAAAGLDLVLHQKEMAIMGFAEVLKNIFKIAGNLRKIKKDIKKWQPDLILLVDYPGFNFKIAKFAHKRQIPIHYYISPKVWAWKEGRVELIRKYVTKLYSILPFEIEYFAKHGITAIYVGNPSKETVDHYLAAHVPAHDPKKIALLPGSRKQEIESALPIMLAAMKHFPSYKLLVAQAPGFDEEFYHAFNPELELIPQDMYGLLAQCDTALVTSGTATLETALMNVPQIVCYKTSIITYYIAKNVIKLKYISLVNLLLDSPTVLELIQEDFNPEKLSYEVNLILKSREKRAQIARDYEDLHLLLGNLKPSQEVAKHIWQSIS
jgi:lipid-A-disaccharide synthase